MRNCYSRMDSYGQIEGRASSTASTPAHFMATAIAKTDALGVHPEVARRREREAEQAMWDRWNDEQSQAFAALEDDTQTQDKAA